MSGVRRVVCHPFHCHGMISCLRQFAAANQRRDETVAMKAKMERRIFCYLCHSKTIRKGDVVGM